MEVYQHFRPEEYPFIDRVKEWVDLVVDRHQTKRTDFLDPRQIYIFSTIVSGEPLLTTALYGGSPEAERKRAILTPHYEQVDQNDFGLAVLEISSSDQRFSKLKHQDVMGALLGLGLKRNKIGDIHLHQTYCHCVVAEEMASFIQMQLHQIHRLQVRSEIIPTERLHPRADAYAEMVFSVASLRLDNILSDAVRLSRAKIVSPIKAGDCKVNWKIEQNPAALLSEGDVVSLRGFGRIRIFEINGPTKKGRWKVKAGKLL